MKLRRIIGCSLLASAFLAGSASAQTPTTPEIAYMPGSYFNANVQSWTVDPNSSAIVSEFNTDWQTNYGNVGVNGRPVMELPAGQPDVAVGVQSGCNNDGISSAPIPSWALNSGPTDYISTFYQPSSGDLWEFWQLTGGPGHWTACWGGETSMSTFDGVFPWPYGETAAGISNAATEVTQEDMASVPPSGNLGHAIALQVVNGAGDIFPADRGDFSEPYGVAEECKIGGVETACPAEGTWFRFSPSVNCASYTTTVFEHAVCVTGQDEGFVVVDHGGSDGIEADYATNDWFAEGNSGTPGSWVNGKFEGSTAPLEESMESTPGNTSTEQQEYTVIAKLPWASLQVVDPPSVILTATCTVVNGVSQANFYWQGGAGDVTWYYQGYGPFSSGATSSPYSVQDADGNAYVTVNGHQSQTLDEVCDSY